MSLRPYQYVTLRCVPREDRGEFLNVGVVLFCHATDFLGASWQVDDVRLAAFAPGLDPARVREALEFVDAVCRADPRAGTAAAVPVSQRFGLLKAPRSTVVQPGPVHGGLAVDPAGALDHLVARLVATGPDQTGTSSTAPTA